MPMPHVTRYSVMPIPPVEAQTAWFEAGPIRIGVEYRRLTDAVAAANGIRVYVCNVATQPGETGFYSAAQHLEALIDHVGDGLFDYVLLNDNHDARRPEGWLGQPVQVDVRRLEELPITIVEEDLIDVTNAHRHDPAKLAAALMRIQQQDRAERPRLRRTISRPTASVG